MFNSLTGIITGKFPQKLFIETHGIEWDVTVPDNALDKLPPVGEVGKVYTWMQHTEALMTLFGFASVNDRSLFFDLLKVDGIGPKGALKILSNIESENLAHILDSGDVSVLEKVPGVGKKTAAKMMLQLKGKLTIPENSPVTKQTASPYADVIMALVNMGYDKRSAEVKIEELSQVMEKDNSFSSMSVSAREDALFRRAIVELTQ